MKIEIAVFSIKEFEPKERSNSFFLLMKIPFSLIILSWLAFCLLAVSLSVFGIMYSANNAQLSQHYTQLSFVINQGALDAANQIIYDLKEAANAVYRMQPSLQNCNMPPSNYSQNSLVQLFNSLNSNQRPLSSLGMMQKAPGTPNGKVSWQIASGYGCNNLMYAFCDPSSYPNFYGFCVNALSGNVTSSEPAYVGTDWGLKPQEATLLASQEANKAAGGSTFLPVFALLGYYTLTFEQVTTCPGSNIPYAIVFAEQSLAKLDTTLASLTQNLPAVSLIVERTTGFLISSSIPNQTQYVYPNQTIGRVNLCVVTSICNVIGTSLTSFTNTAGYNWNSGGQWIVVTPFTNSDLSIDWIIIVSIKQTSFTTTIQSASNLSIGLSLGIIFIVLVITLVGTYLLLTRPLKGLSEFIKIRDPKRAGSSYISEVDGIYQSLNAETGKV